MKKKTDYTVSFIGSGKAANALAVSFYMRGVKIQEIFSRNKITAKKLAKKVNAEIVSDISKMKKSDFIILAVKDDAISGCAKKIKQKNTFLLHISGSISLNVVKRKNCAYGVLYPLQTFTGDEKGISESTPVFIETEKKADEKKLLDLTGKISANIRFADSETRRKIHLAAVIVSNFPNYLYAEAEKMLLKQKIPFDVLIPLIEKVTANLKKSSPSKNQTGPAFRKDNKTMKEHLKMLHENKKMKKIYTEISSEIQQFPFDKRNHE